MKIHYFDIYARAEGARMLLGHAKQPFENVYYTQETWPAFKATGKLDFNQLPALELPDGRLIVQSNSIVRYLGRLYGYYPEDDAYTAWRIDSTFDVVDDFINQFGKYSWENDEARKAVAKEGFYKWFPSWLGSIEKRLLANTSQKYIVGDKQTIADIALDTQIFNKFFNEAHKDYAELQAAIAPFEVFTAYVKAQKEELAEYLAARPQPRSF